MKVVLVADTFPPLRTSGAVQLHDLAVAFRSLGHEITVIVSSPSVNDDWQHEEVNGVEIFRIRSPNTRDVGSFRRALAELITPLVMLYRLRRSPLAERRWDGVVWYSPTIFLGLLIRSLRRRSSCRTYLILRDIFPEWAADMGLIRRGPLFYFFKAVAEFQYQQATVIGVQTSGNKQFLRNWSLTPGRRLEVLHNWIAAAPLVPCSIRIDQTPLKGRRVFVYTGNMGIAQGMDAFLLLAERLAHRADIGFLFVGRGSEVARLRGRCNELQLANTLFVDEIPPAEIPALNAQCAVGIVSLDARHKTHNIPGKFISYMRCGLPVLACINPGNDLEELISTEAVGRVCTTRDIAALAEAALDVLHDTQHDTELPTRCQQLANRLFSPLTAAQQIVEGIKC